MGGRRQTWNRKGGKGKRKEPILPSCPSNYATEPLFVCLRPGYPAESGREGSRCHPSFCFSLLPLLGLTKPDGNDAPPSGFVQESVPLDPSPLPALLTLPHPPPPKMGRGEKEKKKKGLERRHYVFLEGMISQPAPPRPWNEHCWHRF